MKSLKGIFFPKITRAQLKTEWRASLVIAAPMSFAYLSKPALLATDIYFIGQFSTTGLAALSLASVLFLMVFLPAMGVFYAITPLAGQALGKHQFKRVAHLTCAGLHVAVGFAVPITLLLFFISPVFHFFGMDKDVVAQTQSYMHIFAFSFFPQTCFVVLRGLMVALGRTMLPMVIMLGTIPLNAVLDYIFIFGHFGFPAMGLWGAGLATTLVNFISLGVFILAIARTSFFRQHKIFAQWYKIRPMICREILKLGLPISLGRLFEEGMCFVGVFMIGLVGLIGQAAHQTAFIYAVFAFLMILGLADATTSRVARVYAQKDWAGLYRVVYCNLLLGWGMIAVFSLFYLTMPNFLASLFIAADIDHADKVRHQAAILIQFIPISLFFDVTFTILTFALRGMSDTRIPMVLAGVGSLLIGNLAALILAFGLEMGVAGVWWGWVVGLGSLTVFLAARFVWLHQIYARQNLTMPNIPSAD